MKTTTSWHLSDLVAAEVLGTGGGGAAILAGPRGGSGRVTVKLALGEGQRADGAAWAEHYESLQALEHPGLQRVLGVGMAVPDEVRSFLGDLAGPEVSGPGPVPFAILDFVTGKPLQRKCRWKEVAKRDSKLPIFRQALRQVADALQYLHERHFLHRDVTPGNILIDDHNNATLIDLELLVQAPENGGVPAPGRLFGTIDYIAPEALTEGGVLDPRSDVFSLAVIAYEFFVGTRTLPGGSLEALVAAKVDHLPTPPREVRPELSAALEEVLLTGLQPQPCFRYPTVKAFVDALEQALDGPGSHVTPAGKARIPILAQETMLRALTERLPHWEETVLPRVLFLEGQVGVGKTEIAKDFRRQAARQGYLSVLVSARPSSLGPRPAFSLLLKVLFQFYEWMWLPLPELFQLCGSVLPRFFPALGSNPLFRGLPEVVALGSLEEEQRLGDLVGELFKWLAKRHGLTVVIDDAHHLTELEVQVLRSMLRSALSSSINLSRMSRESGPPVVFVLCLDSKRIDGAPVESLLREYRREQPDYQLVLETATREELQVLIETRLESPRYPIEISDLVERRSHGSIGRALGVLDEVLGMDLLEATTNGLSLRQDRWDAYCRIPDLREETTKRLRNLSPKDLEWLRKLAVLEEGFTISLAQALLPGVTITLNRLLKQTEEQGWLVQERDDERTIWRFAQPDHARRLRSELPVDEVQQLYVRLYTLLVERDHLLPQVHPRRLADIALRAGDRIQAFRHYVDAAAEARGRLDNDEALADYLMAADLLRSFTDEERRQISGEVVDVVRGLGELQFARGEREKAVEVYRKLGAFCPTEDKVQVAIEGLSIAFTSFADEGDFSTAESYAWQALTFARESKDETVIGRALVRLSSILFRQKKEDQGEGLLHEAVRLLSKDEAAAPDLGGALNVLGMLERRRGNPKTAKEHFIKASRAYRGHPKDAVKLGMTLHNLAICYGELGESDLADTTYQEANERFLQAAYLPGSGLALNGLGNLHLEQGRLTDARAYFSRAQTIYRNVRDLNREAMCLNNLGEVLIWQGKFIDAEKALQKALHLRREIGSNRILFTQAYIAALRAAQGRYQEGLDQIRDNFHEAETNEARLRQLCYVRLVDLYFGLGNGKMAADCFHLANSMSHETPDMILHGMLHIIRARGLRRLGDVSGARETLGLLIGIEQLQGNPFIGLLRKVEELLLAGTGNAEGLLLGLDELVARCQERQLHLVSVETQFDAGLMLLHTAPPRARSLLERARRFAEEQQSLDMFWMASAGLSLVSDEGDRETYRDEARRMRDLLLSTFLEENQESYLQHPLRQQMSTYLEI